METKNILLNKIYSDAKKAKTNLIYSPVNLQDMKGKNICTFGTFDIFHEGHEKLIRHAIEISGDESKVYIGVASDHYNNVIKNKERAQEESKRASEVKKRFPKANVFLEKDWPELSWAKYWDKYNLDLIIMGGDHIRLLKKMNEQKSINGKQIQVAFFERTPNISTTEIKKLCQNLK